MTRANDQPLARADFDPGPLPTEPLRIFAPLALGDLQTSKSYLENSLIRMASVASRAEKFTTFEERAADAALRDVAETLALLIDAIHTHRVEHGTTDYNGPRRARESVTTLSGQMIEVPEPS